MCSQSEYTNLLPDGHHGVRRSGPALVSLYNNSLMQLLNSFDIKVVRGILRHGDREIDNDGAEAYCTASGAGGAKRLLYCEWGWSSEHGRSQFLSKKMQAATKSVDTTPSYDMILLFFLCTEVSRLDKNRQQTIAGIDRVMLPAGSSFEKWR